MVRIYDADKNDKRFYVVFENDTYSHDRLFMFEDEIKIEDLALISKVKDFPFDLTIDKDWTLNGVINLQENDIIVVESFQEQDMSNITCLSETKTTFDKPVKLSKKSTILVPLERYKELFGDSRFKQLTESFDIRAYIGDPKFAFEMLMHDKRFIFLDLDENGYSFEDPSRIDSFDFAEQLSIFIGKIRNGEITYSNPPQKKKSSPRQSKQNPNSRVITGLTEKSQGEEELDDELFAATDIGKRRENQEDAFLLIKDPNNPNIKMAVVADGMGGWGYGEQASDYAISALEEWFMNLTEEQKKFFTTGVEGLMQDLMELIELKIQVGVEGVTWGVGGTTLVCALIGQKNTMIVNVGDSRAYFVKDGNIIQISREDTRAQRHLEKGKVPSKEAARFDEASSELMQAIGMDRRDLIHPNIVILDNEDYDMLLLFSDGVTDCLSDEDIAIVCKETNSKKLAKAVVEKAMQQDSVVPDELSENDYLRKYIPGGRDNTTAVVFAPKKQKKGEER